MSDVTAGWWRCGLWVEQACNKSQRFGPSPSSNGLYLVGQEISLPEAQFSHLSDDGVGLGSLRSHSTLTCRGCESIKYLRWLK